MAVTWANTPEHYELWDQLNSNHPAGSAYLLSWYLEHQRLPRVDTDIAFYENDGKAVAGAVMYTFRLPGARVCLVPSGPICMAGYEKRVPELIAALYEMARSKGAIVLQFEAFEAEMRDVLRDNLKDVRLQDDAIWKLYHPTVWRELRVMLGDHTPESLLASFRSTTRQFVRKGIKEGLQIEEARTLESLKEVYEVWDSSSGMREYTIRPWDNFLALTQAGYEQDMSTVSLVRREGKVASFVHLIFFPTGSTYMSGGYDPEACRGYEHHFLHYSLMLKMMERGVPYYSFAGPAKKGIRTFKEGFRPVLVDNWRFVTAVLKPAKAGLFKGLLGNAKWIQKAKKIAARKRG